MNSKDIFKKFFYGNVDKEFYGHHNKLINDINIKTTKLLYLLSFVFCAILSLVYLIPGDTNQMAIFYVIYTFLFGAVCIIAFLCVGKFEKSIHIMYWIFEVLAFANLLYVSVYCNPDKIAVTIFVIMLVLPVLYVCKPWESIVEITIAYTIFVILDLVFKRDYPDVIRTDMINALTFYAVTFAAIIYIRHIHISALNASILFKKEAQIDKLTNIYNKSAIESYTKELLKSNHGSLALVVLDIDDFKLVNDRFGHNQGDRFLSSVSRTLTKNFQGTGVLGRIGGDEFMILCENIYDNDIIVSKINNSIETISKSFTDFSNEKITCSVGVTFLKEGDSSSFEELYKEADRALYLAKDRGKNQCVIYKPFDDKNKYPLLLCEVINEDDELVFTDFLRDNYNLMFSNERDFDEKYKAFEANLRAMVIRYSSRDCPIEVFKNKLAGLSKHNMTLIVISDTSEIESDALKLGASEFITIPTAKDILLLRVKNALKQGE